MDDQRLDILTLELERIGTRKKLQSHETLVHFGEKARKIYFVKKGGIVLLHVHPITGKERAINFFIPGFHPIATVAESFTLNKPSKYRLATFTTTELFEIDRSAIQEYIESSELVNDFQQYGIHSLLEKNELRAMLISLNSEEMLRYLYEQYPQIIQQVPSKYIANFLGITPQWYSVLKGRL